MQLDYRYKQRAISFKNPKKMNFQTYYQESLNRCKFSLKQQPGICLHIQEMKKNLHKLFCRYSTSRFDHYYYLKNSYYDYYVQKRHKFALSLKTLAKLISYLKKERDFKVFIYKPEHCIALCLNLKLISPQFYVKLDKLLPQIFLLKTTIILEQTTLPAWKGILSKQNGLRRLILHANEKKIDLNELDDFLSSIGPYSEMELLHLYLDFPFQKSKHRSQKLRLWFMWISHMKSLKNLKVVYCGADCRYETYLENFCIYLHQSLKVIRLQSLNIILSRVTLNQKQLHALKKALNSQMTLETLSLRISKCSLNEESCKVILYSISCLKNLINLQLTINDINLTHTIFELANRYINDIKTLEILQLEIYDFIANPNVMLSHDNVMNDENDFYNIKTYKVNIEHGTIDTILLQSFINELIKYKNLNTLILMITSFPQQNDFGFDILINGISLLLNLQNLTLTFWSINIDDKCLLSISKYLQTNPYLLKKLSLHFPQSTFHNQALLILIYSLGLCHNLEELMISYKKDISYKLMIEERIYDINKEIILAINNLKKLKSLKLKIIDKFVRNQQTLLKSLIHLVKILKGIKIVEIAISGLNYYLNADQYPYKIQEKATQVHTLKYY